LTIFEPFTVDASDQAQPWAVLAGGERTGGLVAFGQARMPAHHPGPGRHVHTREDETIFVISGVLTLQVGEQRIEAGPGTLQWLPRRVPHAFANLSDEPVWAVGVIVPAGMEKLFTEQAEYFASLQGQPPDPQVMLELSKKYGILPSPGPSLARASG
jgi:mannose-6-phosphate isomerase-like protein (cupin superfamily)